MMSTNDSLPDDVEMLKRARARDAELRRRALSASARAEASSAEALIAHLRLTIEKLKRDLFGAAQRAQGASARPDGASARGAGSRSDRGRARGREGAASSEPRRCAPSRARSPRASRSRRICRASACIVPGPTACACCGSTRLAKLGEDVTETLEVVPRQWKVVQHVREKFTCRDCEKISQAPAPFHVLPRGFAGPSLLAMILFEKYGQHQPLNRQSERYAREGVDLSVSTLADQVGGCAAAAAAALRAHPRPCVCRRSRARRRDAGAGAGQAPDAQRSTMDLCARRQAVRRAGSAGRGVLLLARSHGRASGASSRRLCRDSAGRCLCRIQSALRRPTASPGRSREASCWAHGRRKFFELADVTAKARGKLAVIAPLAFEAVKRIDAIFDIEREINGRSIDERLAVRRARVAPLVSDLEAWMRTNAPSSRATAMSPRR